MNKMDIKELRRELETIKIHVDQAEVWCAQVMNMVYSIENRLMDEEEKESDKWLRSIL